MVLLRDVTASEY